MACKDCASGTLHQGHPTGRTEILHGLEAYVADPPAGTSPKGIVVIIPDAFGWETPNNRLLADTYAKRAQMTVYLPEFMDGNACPVRTMHDMDDLTAGKGSYLSKIPVLGRVLYDFVPFLYYNRVSVATSRIIPFFTSVRASSPLPLFAAGFCWGGKFAILLSHPSPSSQEKPLITAAFTAHPSNLVLPADVEKAEVPVSISIGEKDFVLRAPGVQQIREVFERKEKGRFEIEVVEGAKHGFAVRGNPEDEEEAGQAQKAEDQAIAWFERWSS